LGGGIVFVEIINLFKINTKQNQEIIN
jgi:hypothetical protein